MNVTEDLAVEKLSRRSLLTKFGAAGIGAAATAMLAGCGGSGGGNNGAASLDQQILNAAATAEALAVVTYSNIINASPLYTTLVSNPADQAYLHAALEQEASHYNTLVGAGAVPLATTFYFPTNMFSDVTFQLTLNTLLKLEYAFIAAYLIGIRDFSTSSKKVLAGQILGVEAEHRALARVVATDLGLQSVDELQGLPELLTPSTSHAANNLSYERTYSSGPIKNISDVVTYLTPFVTINYPGNGVTAYPFATGTSATTPIVQDQTTA